MALRSDAEMTKKKIILCTEPSYQNENSDSVSRKPLDQVKIASNTKYIDLFHATFVSTISLKTTIHSINQVNLSSFTHFPY